MATRVAKVGKEVYRGYMPPDLPQHRPPNRIKPWWKIMGRPRVTIFPKQDVEAFSDEPEYPPLNDGSEKGIRSQVRYDWYEALKSLPTAEQKFYEINRHCTHHIAHINNWLPACNSLPMIQYLTQTTVINSLPEKYIGRSTRELDNRIILDQIALDKYESIKGTKQRFISKSIRDGNKQSYISNGLVQNIINAVKKMLVPDVNSQLLNYQVDLSPSIRSWWYHSGFAAPNNKPFYKSRKDEDGNINQMIQMDGSSAMNWRSDSFIEPIVDLDVDMVNDTSLVQRYSHSLKYYGAKYKFKWPVALPGFWYEAVPRYDCPHTCFLTTDCLRLRNQQVRNYAKPLDDDDDCLTGQAILTAFGWLNSLSMYHGYTPFHELDYPFTSQVITTDGQNWLFNVYQLNSHSFHRDFGGPKRNNICWSSGILQLYETYEDGNFKGINDDVLNLVIKFLSQQTSQAYTEQLNLRPYLGEDTRSPEEKEEMSKNLRKLFEGRTNKWLSHDWQVPLFEHIFFRSKASRHQIRHMKPKWHIPKPLPPKIFE